MNVIIQGAEFLVIVFCFVYALFLEKKFAKRMDENRIFAWDIYKKAAHVLICYEHLNHLPIDKTVPNTEEITETMKNGYINARRLLLVSIIMIKWFERKFDYKTIHKWSIQKRFVDNNHFELFKLAADVDREK